MLRERNRAEPVELEAIAAIQIWRRQSETGVGRLNFRAVIRVGQSGAVLKRAIEKREVR